MALADPASETHVVAIVDDEPAKCDSLAMLLSAAGHTTRSFHSAEAFLREPLSSFDCAIVDLHLGGMDGLQFQAELGRRESTLPIIVITAHGDVAGARDALRAGALDFIEKPIDDDDLLAMVSRALTSIDRPQQSRAADAQAQVLLGTLSVREREVFDRVIDGMHNREIAVDLGISPRTVEVYRAHVMAKLQARRLADLLRLSSTAVRLPHDDNGGSAT